MITVIIGGSDESDVVLLDTLALVEVAYRGEVGMGGFQLEDVGGARNVPALKPVTVDESAATPARAFTGFVAPQRTITRGSYPTGTSRVFDISVVDINTMLDDRLLSGASADRSEETDYQRVSWLLGTTAMTGISAGIVPDANTVTMDAVDYRGTHPRRVLDECAEAASKNFFVYRYGTGPLLFYARHNVASLSSSLRLSTVLSDIDNATTFSMEALRLTLDAQRVYSTIRLVYANGIVKVSNAAAETTYRHREYHAVDNSITTEAKALAKAKEWLAQAAEEERTFACTVALPIDMVNDIRAGQRLEVKVPHFGIGSFTWMRVTRREVMPRAGRGGISPEYYDLNLEFAPDIRTTRFGGTLPPTYGGSSVDDFETDGEGPHYGDGVGGDRPPNCIECPPSGNGNGGGGPGCGSKLSLPLEMRFEASVSNRDSDVVFAFDFRKTSISGPSVGLNFDHPNSTAGGSKRITVGLSGLAIDSFDGDNELLVSGSDKFSARFRMEGRQVRVKMWLSADPEPTDWTAIWTILEDLGDNPLADYMCQTSLVISKSTTTEVTFDNLSIITGHPGTPTTDTFSRTVSDSWGTSEIAGYTWEANGRADALSVSSGEGKIASITSGSPDWVQAYLYFGGP